MAKSVKKAYRLWLISIFGWLGLHRLYLGKKKATIPWMSTFGLLGIGALIDFLVLPWLVNRYNLIEKINRYRKELKELKTHKEALVAAQKFEEAADVRSRERNLELQVTSLLKRLKQ